MVLRQALIRIFGGIRKRQAIDFKGVVGAIGFEPTASWSRTRRASQAALRPDIAQERDSRAGTKNSTAKVPRPETPVPRFANASTAPKKPPERLLPPAARTKRICLELEPQCELHHARLIEQGS